MDERAGDGEHALRVLVVGFGGVVGGGRGFQNAAGRDDRRG